MKPIIGINVDIKDGPPQIAQVQANYFNSVLKAGGIPILLPPMPQEDLNVLLKEINGLLLIGGPDYDPGLYNETACTKVSLVAKDRENFDVRLIDKAIKETELPILGICAGAQLINIALNGSLYQDIPTEFPESKVIHSSSDSYKAVPDMHEIEIVANSRLADFYDRKKFAVPTSHHQSVKELGDGLAACAHAEDGVIEAVELKGKPFTIGVQWHPERDFEGNKKLFEEFIRHAARVTVSAK